MRPQKPDVNLTAPPLKNRAPGSQIYRHPRGPRCSGSRSAKRLLCETYHGEKGDLIRGSTSLSRDGSQLESCSGYLGPRDGSTSSLASERLVPRAQRKPAAPAGTFSKAHLYISKCMQMITRKGIRLEFLSGPAGGCLGKSELHHPSP